jgi:hypothetical protein
MAKQREIGCQEKPKKENNLDKFKGVLKGARSRIRKRAMPFVLGSLVAISPAFMHQEAYSQDSIAKMEQIRKDNPKLANEESLLYILYLRDSVANHDTKESKKRVIGKVGNLIEKNNENRIFCITLNSVMAAILDNSKRNDYYIDATDSRMIIKDRRENPTKMLVMGSSGRNGVDFHIFYYEEGEKEKGISLHTGSTRKDVDGARTEVSRFFGTLLSGMILINTELEENRKK